MGNGDNTWAVVLAAGDGSRLSTLTTTPSGVSIPKQFCSLRGGASLLHEAIKRAESIVPPHRTCTIVAAQHRIWWERPLACFPAANVIVQPRNRGTANGVLLPLLHILTRDPDAQVILLPSDHHIREEARLARALRKAIGQLPLSSDGPSDGIVLLGIEPEESDAELGYIVPGRACGEGSFAVERFVEKPSEMQARELIGRGGLWNAFIIAAAGRALLGLFERRCADVVASMRTALQREATSRANGSAIDDLYGHLPLLDFSKDILEGQEMHLRVLPVARCGWSDLGTPKRVAETLRRVQHDEQSTLHTHAGSAYLDLAAQFSGCQSLGSTHA
jgi:mannose-1-phosphate guanylyltransferase